jgi:hypothetical protein
VVEVRFYAIGDRVERRALDRGRELLRADRLALAPGVRERREREETQDRGAAEISGEHAAWSQRAHQRVRPRVQSFG